ncbi:MAG: hypothetical protein LBN00_03745 [Oscillospiraceae bacterium]|nr:hypothetical protein [Oscillospiraceae bacterium]
MNVIWATIIAKGDIDMNIIWESLSAIGAILGAFATILAVKLDIQAKKGRVPKMQLKIENVIFAKIPDSSFHSINLVATNISNAPFAINKIRIRMHGHECEAHFDTPVIVGSYNSSHFNIKVVATGNFIMDGRYDAEFIVETERNTMRFSIKEGTLMSVFHEAEYSNDL